MRRTRAIRTILNKKHKNTNKNLKKDRNTKNNQNTKDLKHKKKSRKQSYEEQI